MPTPYGSRGGMAFSADELRVLGGALAIALQSDPAPEETRAILRLAQAVDEAVSEARRLRAFVRADLARHRAALPGAAAGYLDLLAAALAAGHLPGAEDVAAVRALCARPAGERETARRRALLHRVEAAVRPCLPAVRRPADDAPEPAAGRYAMPGPRSEQETGSGAEPEREAQPSPGPAKPGPAERPGSPEPVRPSRPVPTPAEVFPPRRKPSGPPEPAPDRDGPDETEARGQEPDGAPFTLPLPA
ncbi:hypothetical protein ACH4LN_04855 [Streptomyces albus]|uniref:hypothetical protein n=1 Tax=Streptomyces TaxID=1883 RepID=UPI001F2F7E89|nr:MULTISPECIES: hypothetical protein [Streptomyces]UVN55488.1 hypothetical protein NR995_13840 [Streptomyces albus]GHJ23530.1 hypothetical protein TPA0909_51440 [Streptomyces albus]